MGHGTQIHIHRDDGHEIIKAFGHSVIKESNIDAVRVTGRTLDLKLQWSENRTRYDFYTVTVDRDFALYSQGKVIIPKEWRPSEQKGLSFWDMLVLLGLAVWGYIDLILWLERHDITESEFYEIIQTFLMGLF
jgi:hypothetical protein